MRKLKQDDEVIVISGRDKGKHGTLKLRLDENFAVVTGVNKVTKHQKPNPMKNQQGGMVEKEAPIHISNLAIYNPITQKADRVRISVLENGRKARLFASSGEMIDAHAS